MKIRIPRVRLDITGAKREEKERKREETERIKRSNTTPPDLQKREKERKKGFKREKKRGQDPP